MLRCHTYVLLLVLAACQGPVEPPPALSLALSAGDLVPAFSAEIHDYELSAFSARVPTTVTVSGAEQAQLLDFALVPGEPYRLPPLAITKDGVIQVQVRREGRDASYTIHLMPKDLPALTKRVDSPTPGDLFLTPFSADPKATLPPYLLILDTSGDVVYYRRLATIGLDFKRHLLPSGAVRYSYISEGRVHVLDERFAPVAQVQLLATDRHPAYLSDVHDFQMLAEDHFLLMAYVDKVVSNVPEALPHPAEGARVLAAFVQEIRAGAVVFEWDSAEHPELYALSTEGNNFADATVAADYAHMNSMVVDGRDGGLIMSFRHLDAVLKVSRSDGAILWRLGGADDSFATAPAERPSHQHFASLLPDGRLQLFDNGNASMASRVLTFGIDEAGSAVSSFASQPLGYYAFAMGSVQRFGTSLVVGLGAHGVGVPDMIEIDQATGERTMELTLPAGYYSYRALKFP